MQETKKLLHMPPQKVAGKLSETDLEIRVKPWLGLLGYAVTRVLGGEVNA